MWPGLQNYLKFSLSDYVLIKLITDNQLYIYVIVHEDVIKINS